MKLIIEIEEGNWEKVVHELSEKETLEMVKADFENMFGEGVKVENTSNQVVLPMEYFLKGVKFHAEAEARGVKLAEEAKAKGEHPTILRMHEDGITKQKGFKEAYLEIISHAQGKFETVESLVKEFGDLSGIW